MTPISIFFSGKSVSSDGFVWICSLIDKNKFLNAYGSAGLSIGTGPFGIGKEPEWEILRLTNKELYMKTTYNGKEYYVELDE